MDDKTRWVLIAEAVEHTEYTHEHIAWLLRHKKVAGKKIGGTWMVDLEALLVYQSQMKEAGTQKHNPQKRI